jgi:hypothetical protein
MFQQTSGGLQVLAVYHDVEPSGTESPRQAPLIVYFVHVFGSLLIDLISVYLSNITLSGGHSHSLAALIFLPI